MPLALRLIAALLAASLGFALAFGAVALVFFVTTIDAGIGGGLLALAAGIFAGIAAAYRAFGRLRP